MKLSKFFTNLGLTATLAISSVVGLPKSKQAQAQETTRPLAILVNGQGDCCGNEMHNVMNALRSMGAEVDVVPWNSLDKKRENASELNDARFLKQASEYIDSIEPDRPVILIGHSFGGDSLLKVVHRINRRIQFLGVLDPVGQGGLRYPNNWSVPPNVDYFFNRWQMVAPWPVNIGVSGIIPQCSARQCDQQEQSLARNADSSEIRRNCRADEFCRQRSGGTITRIGDFLGDVIRDDYGTAAQRLLHEDVPTDAYIQQQIVDKIKPLLANYQPPISEEERIKQLYRQILGREADPGGLSHHINILKSGQQTFEQIRAGMASGQESRNNINNLYRQYLNRDADPGGMEHHVNLLASGQMTFAQIGEGIRNGQEAQQLRNR